MFLNIRSYSNSFLIVNNLESNYVLKIFLVRLFVQGDFLN